MAFVSSTFFIPGLSGNRNWVSGHQQICAPPVNVRTRKQDGAPRKAKIVAEGVPSKDAIEFFQNREGRWRSYRTTHHLAFRQSETGESVITMKCLDRTDERVVQLCKDNDIDPERAQGGCHVTWMATLAWDQEGENHEGETVFALVPEENDVRKGKMLRDRGYAEIIPIAGTYYMDEIDDLNLETPYEGGAVVERFSFDGPNVVNRLSTVKRFGGLSTATFATEQRIKEDEPSTAEADSSAKDDDDDLTKEEILKLALELPVISLPPNQGGGNPNASPYKRSSRWAATPESNQGSQGRPSASSAFSAGFGAASSASTSSEPSSFGERPSATSAFSSGFGATPKITSKPSTSSAFDAGFSGGQGESSGSGQFGSNSGGASSSAGRAATESVSADKNTGSNGNGSAGKSTNEETLEITPEIEAAAKEIGIDLTKVPPSMRDGYIRSFYEDLKKGGSGTPEQ